MPVKCSEIINIMQELAPEGFAEEWDNVGLQIGDSESIINKIMICLDLTKEVLNEAINNGVDMIITHHPLIFRPVIKIDYSEPISQIIIELIKNNINLYCSHTNLDIAVGGTSDYIANMLNLKDTYPLRITHSEELYKLSVFIPKDSVNQVMDAISKVGAGHIGNYSNCTFQCEGKGTFKPLLGSNPYIGKADELEEVSEVKLETIIPSSIKSVVIDSMIKAHPYEEVAYDLYLLENNYKNYGFGRVGYLESGINIKELAFNLKDKLEANYVRVISNKDDLIKKIAICTGSGGEFIRDAANMNCDCYITGDIKYHEAQLALDLGLSIIDAGHFETENIICEYIKELIEKKIMKTNCYADVFVSSVNSNPFQIVL